MIWHDRVVQPSKPKPHLRLHVHMVANSGIRRAVRGWSVVRTSGPSLTAADYDAPGTPPRRPPPVECERTQLWPTSRLALDAAYFQFTCEWPAGRK